MKHGKTPVCSSAVKVSTANSNSLCFRSMVMSRSKATKEICRKLADSLLNVCFLTTLFLRDNVEGFFLEFARNYVSRDLFPALVKLLPLQRLDSTRNSLCKIKLTEQSKAQFIF